MSDFINHAHDYENVHFRIGLQQELSRIQFPSAVLSRDITEEKQEAPDLSNLALYEELAELRSSIYDSSTCRLNNLRYVFKHLDVQENEHLRNHILHVLLNLGYKAHLDSYVEYAHFTGFGITRHFVQIKW